MDKIEKQIRAVLGDDAVDALENIVRNEHQAALDRPGFFEQVVPKDIQERMAEASKDAGPSDMVLIVPPGPSRIGRMPDIGRGLKTPIVLIPMEMDEHGMLYRVREAAEGSFVDVPVGGINTFNGDGPTISEKGMEMLKDRGVPVAIDCKINPNGSLSFGVVPPDADHPPIMEVGGYSDKFKGPDVNPNVPKTMGEGDPINIHRKMLVGRLRPEHKLENVIPDSTLIMYILPGMTKEQMLEQMTPEVKKQYDEGKIVLRYAPVKDRPDHPWDPVISEMDLFKTPADDKYLVIHRGKKREANGDAKFVIGSVESGIHDLTTGDATKNPTEKKEKNNE